MENDDSYDTGQWDVLNRLWLYPHSLIFIHVKLKLTWTAVATNFTFVKRDIQHTKM